MGRPRRLILGTGPIARTFVNAVRDRPGSLSVVTNSRRHVESFRDDGIDARQADPTDPEAYPDGVTEVFVAGSDAETNRAAATSARRAFPDALLVVFAGNDATPELCAALETVADHVVDPSDAVASAAVDLVTGEETARVAGLLRVLRGIDGKLAVVMHDNPDPDAIASALALVRIARAVGLDASPCYFGEISHQENRALVNLLGIDLQTLSAGTDMAEYGGIALVDHSRPGVNDGLPAETEVDVAIDHHPPRGPVDARYLDLRSEVGATSTLLTRYLRRLAIDPDQTLATALLFGIRVDTNDFARGVSTHDFDAAAFLTLHADHSLLDRVETPSLSPEVLETLAQAIRMREVRGDALATNVGEIRDRDALAQAADHLLNMEGVHISLVYGYMNGTVYVSGRARGTDVDLGETLRDALDSIGSAGGHADMAGAQIDLGLWGQGFEDTSDVRLRSLVTDVVNGRFFETLETAPSTPSFSHSDFGFEFPVEDELAEE